MPITRTAAAAIRDAIDTAIADHAANGLPQTVKVDGRTVTYQNLDQMLRAREAFARLANRPDFSDQSPFGKKTLLRPKSD